jgi:hypothetical protein
MADTTTRERVSAKDPETKLAHRRLTVLELAQTLGNVTEACRQGGIDRSSFDEGKRRFQLQGLDGLKDLPPIAKSHPMRRRRRWSSASASWRWRTRPPPRSSLHGVFGVKAPKSQ